MDLDQLRDQIDAIDEELVSILNQRAKIVVEIGKLKNADQAPVYAPDREKVVLDKICRANKGPLPDRTLAAIYICLGRQDEAEAAMVKALAGQPDITLAKTVLDWEPRIPLESGLEMTVDYFRRLIS